MFWHDISEIKEDMHILKGELLRITDLMSDAFGRDNDLSSINIVHDKLNDLLDQGGDGRDYYLKNVDRLNAMINEFKGCVSVARASLQDRRQVDEHMVNMERLFASKLDAIHRAVCEKPEKKRASKKKKKKAKKAVRAVRVEESVLLIRAPEQI